MKVIIDVVSEDVWFDGICNVCGSAVYETACCSKSDLKNHPISDYKNACVNVMCKENKWHFVGDMVELDYYKHV